MPVVAVKISVPNSDQPVYLAADLNEFDIKTLEGQGAEVFHAEDPHLQTTEDGKHGFAFLVPLFAGLPGAAMIVGAATLGLVGGVATGVGGKVANWIWPDKS